ncbi:unnamed protein product [Schistosoma mattheei]|uniref:Uncharacterized protein n=1 Tax=Schistosoma mattheei TaxID=31246 RepID=A0A183NML7_9TREM|nr:unnamed protein product [Schistosoma mattheei]
MSQKCQSTRSICNSICLPPLPTNQHGHLGLRDHVDLPLCLALCHLQLSEAIEKVPEDPCALLIYSVMILPIREQSIIDRTNDA